jgi:hypothetical protein
MSLKPADLAVADYKVALKPGVGYEKQLFVSTQQSTELGTIEVVAPNSGTYTPNQADNLQLAAVPQELMVVLDRDVNLGTALTITVNGLDSLGSPISGVAVFQPPTYAQDQSFGFPRSWAQEVTTTPPGGKFKQVNSVSTNYAGSGTATVILMGVPTLDATANGTFRKIATKVSLNLDPQAPMPTAVQDGRFKGKYIKLGEVDIASADVTAKNISSADGLSRINGRRVTGWVKELKEDQVHTQNILLLGLILTTKEKIGESVDPNTLDATAMSERYAFIMAH